MLFQVGTHQHCSRHIQGLDQAICSDARDRGNDELVISMMQVLVDLEMTEEEEEGVQRGVSEGVGRSVHLWYDYRNRDPRFEVADCDVALSLHRMAEPVAIQWDMGMELGGWFRVEDSAERRA